MSFTSSTTTQILHLCFLTLICDAVLQHAIHFLLYTKVVYSRLHYPVSKLREFSCDCQKLQINFKKMLPCAYVYQPHSSSHSSHYKCCSSSSLMQVPLEQRLVESVLTLQYTQNISSVSPQFISFHFSACLILQRFVYQTVLYWVCIVFLVQLADTCKLHTPFLIHSSYPGFTVFALITVVKESRSLNKIFLFVQFSYTVNSVLYKRSYIVLVFLVNVDLVWDPEVTASFVLPPIQPCIDW